MLLGDSGVGKSSTVNHLLNRQVADTSDSKSETHSTMEHILVAPDPNLAASDVSLSVVDSPGFNDTDGLEQDARNLRSIDKFYQTHPSLMGKAYPNVIVVTLRATDTRYQGKHSCFMRCLRAIKRLKLIDHINPNIVVVVTWACSISPKAMADKKSKIKNILLEVLHVEIPVLCLENRPEDFELEKIGDYTRLPDGTIQPKNLFEAMIKVTKDAGDEFAQHCLSTHFDSESVKGFDIKRGLSKPAKTSGLSDMEYDILVNLKEDFTDVQYIPEVAQMIDKFINGNTLTEVGDKYFFFS